MEGTAPAAPPPIEAAPVLGHERIHLIDSLRGFALFGVLTANIWLWFSGTFLLFPDYQEELQRLTADSVSYFFINTLISGKFITIFSFLFGLGFSIQLQRALARGETVTRLYLRRLVILLSMGLFHGFLIWYGDVLLLYSLLGFVLLLFGRRKTRTVIVSIVILLVVWPLFGGVMAVLFADQGGGADFAEQLAELSGPVREAFAAGGYADIRAGNIRMLQMFWGGQYVFFMPYVLGVFLIGLLTGRAGVLVRPLDYEPQLRRVRSWALVITIPANAVMLYIAVSYSIVEVFSQPEMIFLQSVLTPLTMPTLAAVYVTTLALLYQQPAWRARFGTLAPVGRMALTNYLSQSVICIGIYYGIGLGMMNTLTPVSTLPVAIVIFTVQILWSRWWLDRYRFGPAEWLWRSLTYGRRQPMGR